MQSRMKPPNLPDWRNPKDDLPDTLQDVMIELQNGVTVKCQIAAKSGSRFFVSVDDASKKWPIGDVKRWYPL